jgi:tRNA(Arg) A34 adenosine deaminase TadA
MSQRTEPASDETFLLRAVALGRRGMEAREGGPFGAVVVQDGRIVGEGWNRVLAANDPTAHAEIEAVRDACRRLGRHELESCVLYASAEPCPMCLAALYWARIDRIVFAAPAAEAAAVGFDDRFIREQLCRPLAARSLPELPHPLDEARQLLADYAADPDRVRY